MKTDMAKKTPLEKDEAQLKGKVRERRAATDNPEGSEAFRALHKRLKRLQRKRRSMALRKQHAMGKKKPDAAAKAEPAATA
jgi:hypothetical protein